MQWCVFLFSLRDKKTAGQSRSPSLRSLGRKRKLWDTPFQGNLVPRACDPREGTWGSGIIRCRKPGILAKIELRIPYQRPIRFLHETDYPRASRSFPRIAGSGNEIGFREESDWPLIWNVQFNLNQNSWLSATDYPRAFVSFPRIAGSGNEIDSRSKSSLLRRPLYDF
jgi:hypothetical protein